MTSKTVLIIFLTNNGEVLIEYDANCTIDHMLDIFLSKTNSIPDKDPAKILFISKSRLLNSKKYLHQTILQLKLHNNDLIKITDTRNIVGGNK